MVEKADKKQPGRGKADWAALYERWRGGDTAEALAQAFALSPVTVAERCRWLDQAFAPTDTMRLRHGFARGLVEAEAALGRGEAAEAERRAKALIALIRAARALEELADAETDAAAAAGGDFDDEPFDPKAELEAKIRRFIDAERRRSLSGGADPV
jgi:hypothetical protein